jgi:hypothetical protein
VQHEVKKVVEATHQEAGIFNFKFTDIMMLLPILRSGESAELGLEVGF